MSKISAYSAAAALDGTEAFPVVQSGSTVKALISAIRTYILSKKLSYTSGRYYMPEGLLTTGAGSTMVAGTTYLTPGMVRKSVTIASLVARITTLAAGGNAQIAIYAADATTGDPTGAPLFNSTSQSTGATGIVEVATSQALSPDTLYWVGLQVDNTSCIFETVGAVGTGLLNIAGVSGTSNFLNASNAVGLTKAGTFGTWPTFTGNRATDSLSEITSRPPAWGFKVA